MSSDYGDDDIIIGSPHNNNDDDGREEEEGFFDDAHDTIRDGDTHRERYVYVGSVLSHIRTCASCVCVRIGCGSTARENISPRNMNSRRS